MTDQRAALLPEITRMRDLEGLKWREIAERLGIGRSTAHDYYTDPDGSAHATRQARYRATDFRKCPNCNGTMAGRTARAGSQRCGKCRDAQRKERLARMIELRREGFLNTEIAERLGVSVSAVTHALSRARKADSSIPPSPRYRVYPTAND